MRVGDGHDEARRRLEHRMPEGRPLVLPHAYVRRLVDKRPTVLIVGRRLLPATHEIHDALTMRKNGQHRRRGRPDLQEDPLIVTIEITSVDPTTLGEIDLTTARTAGYKVTEELHDDWRARRRELDLTLTVHICPFVIVEAFYLHKLVHRGYTTDPAHAANDEPEALPPEHLERFAAANEERYRQQHADEIARREARSLANQLREAQRRAQLSEIDITPEIQAIRQKLDQIHSKLGAAA